MDIMTVVKEGRDMAIFSPDVILKICEGIIPGL